MNRTAPTLETERLILSGHTLDDYGDVAGLWSEPDVVRYIGGRPFTAEESWARLLRYAGAWALMGYGFWTFRAREGGQYLGEGGLLNGRRSLGPDFDGSPEMGWALHPSAHGRGYGAEALQAITGWADAQGIDRAVCLIEPDNGPSVKLAEKLGFARFRETTYHGARVDLFKRQSA